MAANALTPKRPVLAAGLFLLFVAALIWRGLHTPAIAPGDEIILSGPTMGTTFTVKLPVGDSPFSDTAINETAAAIEALLADINAKMSTYDPSSELSRFNTSQSTDPFPISPDTHAVIQAAQAISKETNGAFDITVGPLVNAWGFGPGQRTLQGPDDTALQELRTRVGYQNLSLNQDPTQLTKKVPTLNADLSAIAKGYAVDRIAQYLSDNGYQNFMVEIGGEIRTAGKNAYTAPWRIAIKRPTHDGGPPSEIIDLSNLAMATSGDYENYFEVDGQRLSHTIDPTTGRPITHPLASVTVLHKQCMYADAYATAINVMGPEQGLTFAQENNLPAMLIIRTQEGTFQTQTTTHWPK